MTPEILAICILVFIASYLSWLNIENKDEISGLKSINKSLLEQIEYMGKKDREAKVQTFTKEEFRLRQTQGQKLQASIAENLQSYLSTEGLLHVDS